MKKKLIVLILLNFGLYSCESEKKYSDYNESDFIEAQGVITDVYLTSDPFDSPINKNIEFKYYMPNSTQLIGKENNLELNWAEKGVPIVVLVNKNDETISFYGRFGLKDTLSNGEKIFIKDFVSNMINKWKTTYNNV